MDNNHPDTIPIEVDGKTQYAKVGPHAFAIADVVHGYKIKYKELEGIGPGDSSVHTWIALLPNNPELTHEEFVKWDISSEDLGKVSARSIEVIGTLAMILAEGSGSGPKKVGKRTPVKRK